MTPIMPPRLTRRAFLCGAAATAATALTSACGGNITLPALPTATLAPPSVIPCGFMPTPVSSARTFPCGPPIGTRPSGQAGTIAWTDYEGRVLFEYPSHWTVREIGGVKRHWMFLSPDSARFDVTYSDPSVTGVVTAARLQQDQRAAMPDATFTFGPVTETEVGGHPATRYDYTVFNPEQSKSNTFSGRTWLVFQGARWFTFDAFTPSSSQSAADAIITTVRFLRRQNGDY